MSLGRTRLGGAQAMSDEALDRELTELFAVDPSPAFLPSTRARIETESQRRAPWRWTWIPALAVVTLLLFIGFDRDTSSVVPTVSAPANASTTPAPALPEAVMIPSVALARGPQARASGRRTKRSPAVAVDPFDDIQLSAAEQQVLKGLRASWHGVPLPDMTPVPRNADEHPVSVAAIAVADVTVARVVIEPTALMARRQE
jgi:hypothetical protein